MAATLPVVWWCNQWGVCWVGGGEQGGWQGMVQGGSREEGGGQCLQVAQGMCAAQQQQQPTPGGACHTCWCCGKACVGSGVEGANSTTLSMPAAGAALV
jgi:hypothetical protein